VAASLPRPLRNSGVVARPGASNTVNASQPLGQAMPRLTGYPAFGVRLIAWPSLRWMFKLQPVEQ